MEANGVLHVECPVSDHDDFVILYISYRPISCAIDGLNRLDHDVRNDLAIL